jgi:hypothetical protein
MLKIVVLWILLATAMGFAFGAIFVSTVQAPVQAQQAEHYEPAANQQDISLRQRLTAIWARTWEDSVVFYAFVLSIFTALLVFVSLGQTWFLISTGKTARVSADAAKQTANAVMAGQRAYVVPEPYFAPDSFRLEQPLRDVKFGVRWVNIGNLPIRNLRNHIDYRIVEGELPSAFEFPDSAPPIARGTLLTPKQVVFGPHIPRDWDITANQIAAIRSGEQNLYIFGWAKYFDGFPGTPERVTKFCYTVRVTGNSQKPLSYRQILVTDGIRRQRLELAM